MAESYPVSAVNDADVILALRDALEAIRQLTYQPYLKGTDIQRPATVKEKLDAWAKIQSIAAGALRDTYIEEGT
jgi:hypothetical protein